jgi:hypothetical protein
MTSMNSLIVANKVEETELLKNTQMYQVGLIEPVLWQN